MEFELTKEEQNAINSLKRLAKRWPKSLWLFANGLDLHVMRTNDNGSRAMDGDAVDQDYLVDRVDIPNDGGDW